MERISRDNSFNGLNKPIGVSTHGFFKAVLSEVLSALPPDSFLRACYASEPEFRRWFSLDEGQVNSVIRHFACCIESSPDNDTSSRRLYIAYLEHKLGYILYSGIHENTEGVMAAHLIEFSTFQQLCYSMPNEVLKRCEEMWTMGFIQLNERQQDHEEAAARSALRTARL